MVRTLPTCLALACVLLATGCLDPQARLDEHVEDLPAVVPTDDCPALGQDITGSFLFAIDPVPVAPSTLILYQADISNYVDNGATATMDLSLTPLDFTTLEPVPGVEPDVWTALDVDLANDAAFTISAAGITIPAEANSVLGQTITVESLEISAYITELGTFCGTVTSGTVAETGSILIDSTIGTTPITPGGPMPDAVANCDDPACV